MKPVKELSLEEAKAELASMSQPQPTSSSNQKPVPEMSLEEAKAELANLDKAPIDDKKLLDYTPDSDLLAYKGEIPTDSGIPAIQSRPLSERRADAEEMDRRHDNFTNETLRILGAGATRVLNEASLVAKGLRLTDIPEKLTGIPMPSTEEVTQASNALLDQYLPGSKASLEMGDKAGIVALGAGTLPLGLGATALTAGARAVGDAREEGASILSQLGQGGAVAGGTYLGGKLLEKGIQFGAGLADDAVNKFKGYRNSETLNAVDQWLSEVYPARVNTNQLRQEIQKTGVEARKEILGGIQGNRNKAYETLNTIHLGQSIKPSELTDSSVAANNAWKRAQDVADSKAYGIDGKPNPEFQPESVGYYLEIKKQLHEQAKAMRSTSSSSADSSIAVGSAELEKALNTKLKEISPDYRFANTLGLDAKLETKSFDANLLGQAAKAKNPNTLNTYSDRWMNTNNRDDFEFTTDYIREHNPNLLKRMTRDYLERAKETAKTTSTRGGIFEMMEKGLPSQSTLDRMAYIYKDDPIMQAKFAIAGSLREKMSPTTTDISGPGKVWQYIKDFNGPMKRDYVMAVSDFINGKYSKQFNDILKKPGITPEAITQQMNEVILNSIQRKASKIAKPIAAGASISIIDNYVERNKDNK